MYILAPYAAFKGLKSHLYMAVNQTEKGNWNQMGSLTGLAEFAQKKARDEWAGLQAR